MGWRQAIQASLAEGTGTFGSLFSMYLGFYESCPVHAPVSRRSLRPTPSGRAFLRVLSLRPISALLTAAVTPKSAEIDVLPDIRVRHSVHVSLGSNSVRK
jgi:hypothetical protein